MFTPVEYFNNDCYTPQLEYLEDFIHADDMYVAEFIGQFINRYNFKAIKRMDKVIQYMNDKNIQEYLQDLNVDSEKFWYLLLYVYDYSFGQCINNIVTNSTPKEEIEALINIIADIQEPKYIGNTVVSFNLREPVILQVGKDSIPLNGAVTSFIADACREYIKKYGGNTTLPNMNMNIGRLNLDERDNMGFTKMAYYFCYMFKWFFDWIGVKRKEGAIFSNKEKGLLCHLLYLTEICTNENILKYRENDYSTLKGFIKPKTIPEFNSGNRYYCR